MNIKKSLDRIWQWTGIGEKKGWDLITSVSLPVLLFLGGQYFSNKNNDKQQQIADDKQKDEVLKNYFEDMKGLLLDKYHPLKQSKEDNESRTIARTITLTTLSQLGSEQNKESNNEEQHSRRKSLIMQFLFESGLIKNSKGSGRIISLDKADLRFANLNGANFYAANLKGANFYGANLSYANLSYANLNGAYLHGAYLYGAYLYGAYLYGAYLYGANLNGAYLHGAHLYGVDLYGADLSNADLNGANLNSADLSNANLSYANLSYAYLKGAYLKGAYLKGASLYGASLYGAVNLTNKQIKLACNLKEAIFTEHNWNFEKQQWEPTDPIANQKKIDQIKNDTASNLSNGNTPNCPN